MTLPPLMAAILFWGWQTGLWPVAVAGSVLLGVAPFAPLRWTFTAPQMNRVSDFCSVLVALLGVYFMLTLGSSRGMARLFEWLPVVLLPVALMHAYSGGSRMDASVFFWSLRRRPPLRPVQFDPSFPYFAVWIVGASAANVRSDAFFAGIALLAAWPLVVRRPTSYPVGAWAAAFSLATAIGYGTQYSLHELQAWLESAVPEWLVGNGTRTDPYRSTTDIGHLGELKQSDAIVLRVDTAGALTSPLLLHRASYNQYAGAVWLASFAPFSDVNSAGRTGSWMLTEGARSGTRITVHDYSAQTNPVLSLPADAIAIEGLDARRVRRNPLGAVQIERDAGYYSYAAVGAGAALSQSPPTESDLRIGRAEKQAFDTLASELGLPGESDTAIVRRVQQHFRDGYRYSVFQSRPAPGSPAIVDFIGRTRSGHCEYFATATVLLLRAAGVPARYATGFSVQEYSALEGAYVVRQRHAHAWTHAWIDGAWISIDTTPPEWLALESGGTRLGTLAGDAWSWTRYQLARGWSAVRDQALTAALVVALPFAAWLVLRLYRSRQRAGRTTALPRTEMSPSPGSDSEFYRVESRLAEDGWIRRPHETPLDWLARVVEGGAPNPRLLSEIVELHCRYRFDPRGLSPDQRVTLRRNVATWLAGAAPSSRSRAA